MKNPLFTDKVESGWIDAAETITVVLKNKLCLIVLW